MYLLFDDSINFDRYYKLTMHELIAFEVEVMGNKACGIAFDVCAGF